MKGFTKFTSVAALLGTLMFAPAVVMASGDDVPLDEYSAAAIFNPEAFAAKWKADSSKDRVNYSIEPTSEAVMQIFPAYKDGQR